MSNPPPPPGFWSDKQRINKSVTFVCWVEFYLFVSALYCTRWHAAEDWYNIIWSSHYHNIGVCVSILFFKKHILPGGGGGRALPYWRWRGRAAGQGMIFMVIHIDTRYLNRPNWLLAGYSVYHKVASRVSHRVPSPQCLWQARDLGTSDGACGAGPQCLWPARDLGTSDGAPRAGRNRFFMNVRWYTAE